MNELTVIDNETAAALETMDPGTREIAITQMLERAQSYLAVAMQQPDAPRAVADFKAEIIAVAQYAKQKRVSEEIQIDATAMVRRAERSLGVAVREGQKVGTVASRESAAHITAVNREARRRGEDHQITDSKLVRASEYIGSGQQGVDTYAMADDVSDADFDAALNAAKEERNLSRTNVVRKIKEAKGEPAPQEVKRGRPATNKTAQTMERLTSSLWGVRQSLQTITAVDAGLDQDQVAAWIKELSSTSSELNRIKNLLLKGSK